MNIDGFEIERKFLIRYPDEAYLAEKGEDTEIEQTYLLPPEPHINARVRKRGKAGAWVYTHTQKIRLSDMRRIEDEREVSEEAYRTLLQQADPERNVIRKTRWILPYRGQLFEIDLFPFWQDRAIMEIELTNEEQTVEFPPEIQIIREVTSDLRYSNASMSKEIPMDEI